MFGIIKYVLSKKTQFSMQPKVIICRRNTEKAPPVSENIVYV